MARAGFTLFALLAILIAVYHEYFLKALLDSVGVLTRKKIEMVGNTNCKKVETLQACEKLVLHPPSGLLYLACSTPAKRQHWLPALVTLRDDKVVLDDYIATYDAATGAVTRLTFSGFPTSQGYGSHGLDVVPSATNPKELFVYAINHRKPVLGQAKQVGADSVVEIFKTTSPIIDTPNDLVGSPDGKSFYFTNDHGVKIGFSRYLEYLGFAWTSVGYCHVDEGCKIAVDGLSGSNGIVRAQNGTVYVADAKLGGIHVLEEQNDHSLVLVDNIAMDRYVDNLSIDTNEALWVAGVADGLAFISAYYDLEKVSPSSAIRITKNVGNEAFFGEKLKVEKIFEDDGKQASGTTTAVHDARRKLLFLSGVYSAHLTVCKVD
ncbi:serum paraoxonase/arylesterase [Russula aff. rugulosa BPL654]|nr:serum paraoxonase/arylesterase [Russula aff. rugulosa BPL654]